MKHIILLHGALGAATNFKSLADLLSKHYTVHTLNFNGHGGKAFTTGEFSINAFADEVIHYMDENNVEQASLFGYSMGGYVALYIARYFRARVDRVITLATKLHWDEHIAAREARMLDTGVMEQKVPVFAEELKQRHAPNDWKQLVGQTRELLISLGKHNMLTPEDYNDITPPVLLMLGDRDKMVTFDETIAVYKKLPGAQLAVLPGTPHPLEQVDAEMLCDFTHRFFYQPMP